MKKWIEVEFEIEDVVYVKTDDEQVPFIVTAIKVNKGYVQYEVAHGVVSYWMDDFELSKEKNVLNLVL